MQAGTVSRLRFCKRSWGLKIYFGWNIVRFWKSYHTFVPISWMCKKQTSVSHSSSESDIISLDAGLRFDGITAIFLWDLIVAFLGNTTQNHDRTGRPVVEQTWSLFSTSHDSQTQAISDSDLWSGQCWFYSLKRPILLVRKFCCMCLKSMKQWLRWL